MVDDPLLAAVEQLTRVVATSTVVLVMIAALAIAIQCYILVLKAREHV